MTNNENTILMIGQKMKMVCGAMYPDNYGVIVGFEDRPANPKFPELIPAETFVLIRWNGSSDEMPYTQKHEIRNIRIAKPEHGSSIGVYLDFEARPEVLAKNHKGDWS